MNSELKPDPADPRNRLFEALLEEHARLGKAADESLLTTVRALTTERPGPVSKVIVAEPQFGFRDWAKVAAMVTATLGLLWLVFPRGPVFDNPRQEHVFNLVVIPQASERIALPKETGIAGSGIPSKRTLETGIDGLAIPSLDLPGAQYTGNLSFEAFDLPDAELSAELLAEFSVSAERIRRSEPNGRMVYEGDVVLKHPEFTLKADRIELAAAGEIHGQHHQQSVGAFIASGDSIEIDRYSANGTHENARARQVTYQADGGTLILEGGPPTLTTGDSYVVPRGVGGVIVLRQDGYQVIEPPAPLIPRDGS